MNQHSFSSLEQMHKKKCTKREIFLGEMEAVVPWTRLEALIDPYYTKPRKGPSADATFSNAAPLFPSAVV